MSRNIGQTCCYYCGGEVKFDEAPRDITREDVGDHNYDTHEGYGFAGMIVANATCVDCCAKYLAWIDQSKCAGYGTHWTTTDRQRSFHDLSFRSSFNDEPGADDLPLYEIATIRYRTKRYPDCSACGKRIVNFYGCRCKNPKPVDNQEGVQSIEIKTKEGA